MLFGSESSPMGSMSQESLGVETALGQRRSDGRCVGGGAGAANNEPETIGRSGETARTSRASHRVPVNQGSHELRTFGSDSAEATRTTRRTSWSGLGRRRARPFPGPAS